MVRIDDFYFQRALVLYDQRRDKAWGLVDCASFVVMRDIGIARPMTLDHHFEQAGFQRLPTSPDRSNGR